MIAIVIDSLGKGGAERSVLMLASALARRGVALRMVCLFARDDGYAVPPELRPMLVKLEARGMLQAAWRLRRYLSREPLELVYSTMARANIAAVLATRLRLAPLLTSERTTPLGYYRSRLRLTAALGCHAVARCAVFISEYARREGLPDDALGRRVRRRSVVLHNPIGSRLDAGEAGARRAAILARIRDFGAPGAPPVRMLVASRLVDKKGHLEFIEQAADFLRGANVEVTFAGTGPLAPRIAAAIERLGLAGKVRLAGFVDDMDAAYHGSDIVVLTSQSEGFGRVGFEAYLSGCLVVGTPENSFQSEIVASAPAWHVVDDFRGLALLLPQLGGCAIPADYSDIHEMGRALSVEAHARRFLEILSNRVGFDVRD